MKITLPTLKPRNPVARALHKRHGGVHLGGNASRRQAEQRALDRELSRMKYRPPTSE